MQTKWVDRFSFAKYLAENYSKSTKIAIRTCALSKIFRVACPRTSPEPSLFFNQLQISSVEKKKTRDRPLAQLLSARYRCGRCEVRFPGHSNQHSVANGSPPLRRFFGAVLPRRSAAEMSSATRYTLRGSTASVIKI